MATRPDECSVSFGVGKKRRREGRERGGKRGEGREREGGRGREVRERGGGEEKGEKFRRVVLFLNFFVDIFDVSLEAAQAQNEKQSQQVVKTVQEV